MYMAQSTIAHKIVHSCHNMPYRSDMCRCIRNNCFTNKRCKCKRDEKNKKTCTVYCKCRKGGRECIDPASVASTSTASTSTSNIRPLTVECLTLESESESEEEELEVVETIINPWQEKSKKLENEKVKEMENKIDALEKQLQQVQKEAEDKIDALEKQLQQAQKEAEEWKILAYKKINECRILRNANHELTGKIQVFCRIRPRTSKEMLQQKALCNINFIDNCTIEVDKSDGSDAMSCSGKQQRTKQFSFDKVFASNASQADIFLELSLLIESSLEGYNVCIFAYGQAGSGKTYTMEGEREPQTEGIIPRTVRHIFRVIQERQLMSTTTYKIKASFLEIYNEELYDLLETTPKKIEIKYDCAKPIINQQDLEKYLQHARHNRRVASTASNERSSRSHLVVRITVSASTKEGVLPTGNLDFVDLAGSETYSERSPRAQQKETTKINCSLSALTRVIRSISNNDLYIPYRDSILTYLLKSSLGANTASDWPRVPAAAICPQCSTLIITVVVVRRSTITHLTALTLFLLGYV
ncbi:kinesin-like protein KLP2 isoform X2 [Temnothorax curvispinosus]|uniref:Kinesin-like protein KLP2 isoform X2 n=1 Tax=Temnothorax curvispinosus TaxID=300111 RepID=A0A6J1PSF5_9HYME|nr:kinesin-like protein KLP2 isoform X2 [Temnothorax curvispinosus]